MILGLAIFVELRPVTERQTHGHIIGLYRASIASRDKNGIVCINQTKCIALHIYIGQITWADYSRLKNENSGSTPLTGNMHPALARPLFDSLTKACL